MCKKLALIFALLLFVGITVQASDEYVVEDFENGGRFSSWIVKNNAFAQVSFSKEHYISAPTSLKLYYDYTQKTGENDKSIGALRLSGSENYSYIGFWVYGDESGLAVGLELFSHTGEKITFTPKEINFSGWKYIEFELPKTEESMYFHKISIKNTADVAASGELYFDNITLSKISLASNVIAGEPGMWEIGGESTIVNDGILTGVELAPSTLSNPQISQIGNYLAPMALNYKNSAALPDSISGVAVGGGSEFFGIMPGVRDVQWGTGWLNDGEELFGQVNTVYGTGMFSNKYANEYVSVTFENEQLINKISLIPRQYGAGFPVDYTVQTSTDGKVWNTVATVTEQTFLQTKADMDPVEFLFTPAYAKQVRVNATKLRAEREGVYYFQLRELEAYNTDGVNVACCSEGGIPWSSSVANNNDFSYENYMNNIIESGVKWVNVVNENFYSAYASGSPSLGAYEKENLKLLSDNGINITYRLRANISAMSEAEATALGDSMADAAEWYVRRLYPYVDAWQILNEQNCSSEYSDEFVQTYIIVAEKIAARIKKLLPNTRVELETALIDRSWTKKVLSAGFAENIDVMGIHVYKECDGADQMPEVVGTFFENGVRKYPEDQPYKDYAEEIGAYKQLVQSYNPDIEVWCTETAVNVGDNRQCVTELSQAKYLARQYILHQIIGVGPTCWWTAHHAKTLQTEWGLVTDTFRRRDGWYALRNVANIMNNDFKKDSSVTLSFTNSEDMVYDCFKNQESGVYQIPYWAAVKLRDGNTGKAIDLTISGIDVKNAVCIDMLSGTVQPLIYETNGTQIVFRNLVARDYPMVIRINSDEEYSDYKKQ